MSKPPEQWKQVPSKPHLMASTWGRIKSEPHIGVMPNGAKRTYQIIPTYGYVSKSTKRAQHSYRAHNSRRYGNIKVHRIVCEAFHGVAPFPNAVVLHINENALDNRPENLKWATQKENMNTPKFLAYCRSRTGENSPVIKGRKRRHNGF